MVIDQMWYRVSYVRSPERSGVFGKLLEASAHARIPEMERSAVSGKQ